MMRILYLLLLIAGLAGFVLHLLAQYRVARILHQRYPDQWNIVAASGDRQHGKVRTYARLQRVLRSDIPEMFDDDQLTLWHRCWRYGPWLAWPCWIGALVLSMALGR